MRARPCLVCGTEFIPRSGSVKCCSRMCSREAKRVPRDYFSMVEPRYHSSEIRGYVKQRLRDTVACESCGSKFGDGDRAPVVDHIVPLRIGGTDTPENVRILCSGCNLKRPRDGRDVVQEAIWARHDHFSFS